MNSSEAADAIIKNIKRWSADNTKLVVAIDGLPGVGKSTVLNLMEGRIDALLVHIDNFLTPIEYRQEIVDKGADLAEIVGSLFDYSDIRDLVEKYKSGQLNELSSVAYKSGKRQVQVLYDLSKPTLVMEGTFMLNSKYFTGLWDKVIYLDGDEEEITKRRVARTKEMMGEKFIPENDPRSFFNLGLKAFKNYQDKYQPRKSADLILTL